MRFIWCLSFHVSLYAKYLLLKWLNLELSLCFQFYCLFCVWCIYFIFVLKLINTLGNLTTTVKIFFLGFVWTAICVSPCRNGGVCVNPNVCACKSGFTGSTCQTGMFSTKKPYLARSQFMLHSTLDLWLFLQPSYNKSLVPGTFPPVFIGYRSTGIDEFYVYNH